MEKLKDQTQVIKSIKKAMLDDDVKAVDVADALGVKPQGLQKIWGKKNFSFSDAQKVADALGYDFFYELRKRDGAD